MKYCLCIKLYDSFEAYVYECLDDIKTDDNGCTITLTGKLTSTEPDTDENLVLPSLENQDWINNDVWTMPNCQIFPTFDDAEKKVQQLFQNWIELKQYMA